MPAPKGNQFWKARTKHGRDKIFSTPDVLRDACQEYFQWCEDNPLYASELVKYQGEAKVVEVPKMRAMTISGLCIFLGVSQVTWFEYKKNKDFIKVIIEADEIIRTQKFEGASAELLNPNIIARDLGLKDHTHQDSNHIVKIVDDPAEEMKKRGIPEPVIDLEDAIE